MAFCRGQNLAKTVWPLGPIGEAYSTPPDSLAASGREGRREERMGRGVEGKES